MTNPELFIILLFPILFIGTWCSVCFLLSLSGGWNRLARSYRYDKSAIKIIKKFPMESASLGRANYNNCISIEVADRGLLLSALPIFRLGHPPLFFPWNELPVPETKKVLWAKFHVYHIKGVKVAISDKPVAYALEYMEQKAAG